MEDRVAALEKKDYPKKRVQRLPRSVVTRRPLGDELHTHKGRAATACCRPALFPPRTHQSGACFDCQPCRSSPRPGVCARTRYQTALATSRSSQVTGNNASMLTYQLTMKQLRSRLGRVQVRIINCG
jgi:hypothetical protein